MAVFILHKHMPPKQYKKRSDGKNNTGRPSKLSDAVLRKLQRCFMIDCPVKEACLKAGIPESTFRTRWKSDKKFTWIMTIFWDKEPIQITFKEFVETIRLYPLLSARKAIYEGIAKNPKVAMRVLERRDPRYSRQKSKDFDTKPITVIFWGNPSQFIKNNH